MVYRRRSSPLLSAVLTGFLIVAAVVLTVVSVRDYHRTERTQHAPSIEGVVVSARTEVHHGRHSTTYSADYGVRTASGSSTTVHAHGRAEAELVGREELVKVDPHDRGYAEFPGYPVSSRGQEYASLGFLLVLIVAEVLFVRSWRRRRSRW